MIVSLLTFKFAFFCLSYKLLFKKHKHVDIDEIEKRLNSLKHQIIDLTVKPDDVCIMPNGFILNANSTDRNLTLYDETLSLRKTVDKLDNQGVLAYSITTNEMSTVYILDKSKRKLFVTDLELNWMRTLNFHKSKIQPEAVCYHDGLLYVSDSCNKQIIILNARFKEVNALKVDFEPFYIKIQNNIGLITALNSTYIYSIQPFELKRKYENIFGRISEINSFFYVYNSQHERFYCFNQNGVLEKHIDTKLCKHALNANMVFFNDNLLISCTDRKSFVKI